MEPRYSMLYGALEQLAADRRRALLASARPRRTANPPQPRTPSTRRWLACAIGLRPAPAPAAAPCIPPSV
jgi:hypothetical protein